MDKQISPFGILISFEQQLGKSPRLGFQMTSVARRWNAYSLHFCRKIWIFKYHVQVMHSMTWFPVFLRELLGYFHKTLFPFKYLFPNPCDKRHSFLWGPWSRKTTENVSAIEDRFSYKKNLWPQLSGRPFFDFSHSYAITNELWGSSKRRTRYSYRFMRFCLS